MFEPTSELEVLELDDAELEANPITDPETNDDSIYELTADGTYQQIEAVEPAIDIPNPENWLDGLVTEGREQSV